MKKLVERVCTSLKTSWSVKDRFHFISSLGDCHWINDLSLKTWTTNKQHVLNKTHILSNRFSFRFTSMWFTRQWKAMKCFSGLLWLFTAHYHWVLYAHLYDCCNTTNQTLLRTTQTIQAFTQSSHSICEEQLKYSPDVTYYYINFPNISNNISQEKLWSTYISQHRFKWNAICIFIIKEILLKCIV